MKTNKEEFDRQARLCLPLDHVHLHNEFLLAIVTKCQSLCQPTTYVYPGIKQKPAVVTEVDKKRPIVAQRKLNSLEIKPITITRQIQPKKKPLTVNFDVIFIIHALFLTVYWILPFHQNRFQPVDPVSLLQPTSPLSIEKPHVRFCSRDLTLPDSGLVHGRMLVAAWDQGLDHGCEDKAIKLILAATKQFLKELLVAIVTNRKGYRVRENKVIHSVGQPTINPWLHNSWSIHDQTSNRYNIKSHSPYVKSYIQNFSN